MRPKRNPTYVKLTDNLEYAEGDPVLPIRWVGKQPTSADVVALASLPKVDVEAFRRHAVKIQSDAHWRSSTDATSALGATSTFMVGGALAIAPHVATARLNLVMLLLVVMALALFQFGLMAYMSRSRAAATRTAFDWEQSCLRALALHENLSRNRRRWWKPGQPRTTKLVP